MENLSPTDAAPPHAEAPVQQVRPRPCQYYLASGLLLSLPGALLVWLGIVVYVQRLWPEGSGRFTVLVLGLIVLVLGLSLLARGVIRAGAAIDYLVRQAR